MPSLFKLHRLKLAGLLLANALLLQGAVQRVIPLHITQQQIHPRRMAHARALQFILYFQGSGPYRCRRGRGQTRTQLRLRCLAKGHRRQINP